MSACCEALLRYAANAPRAYFSSKLTISFPCIIFGGKRLDVENIDICACCDIRRFVIVVLEL